MYYAEAVGVFFRSGTFLPVCSIRYVIGSAIYFQIFNHLLPVYSSRCVLNVAWSLDFWYAQFTEFLSIKDMEHDNTTFVYVMKEDFSVSKALPKYNIYWKVELEVQVLLRVLRGREVSKSHEEK